jgi:hypothetical protein
MLRGSGEADRLLCESHPGSVSKFSVFFGCEAVHGDEHCMDDEGERADPGGHFIIVRNRACVAIHNDAPAGTALLASPDEVVRMIGK